MGSGSGDGLVYNGCLIREFRYYCAEEAECGLSEFGRRLELI